MTRGGWRCRRDRGGEPMIRRLLALVATIVVGVSGAFPAAQSVPADSADALVVRAQEQAAREGKSAMVVFGASWCAPCRALDAFLRAADVHHLLTRHFVVQ